MKYSKIKHILYLIMFIINTIFYIPVKAVDSSPALSDEDLKALNLSEEDAKELEQFLSAINNLPPEEQEFLTQLGKEMEKMMVEEGLDPSNPDDIFNWIDKQNEETNGNANNEKPAKIEAPIVQKPEIKPIENTKDIIQMIQDTIKYLSSFRQKVSMSQYMSNSIERLSQELNELTYLLHISLDPEISRHLLEPDFSNLYKNLENIYKILLKNEPNIETNEVSLDDLENPYEALELPINATLEEIDTTYNNLKSNYQPEILRESLKQEGLTEKEIEKRIKQARLSFSFIQNAYDTLKDPKEKALIDRTIKDQIAIQQNLEQASIDAFNNIKLELSNSIFNILSDIKKLLEKHKPEELAKVKAYEEQQKKILVESKKPIRVTPSARDQFKYPKDEEYQEFYRHLAQENQKKYQARPFTPQHRPEPQKNDFTIPKLDQKSDSDKKPSGGKAPEKKGGVSDKKDQNKKPTEKVGEKSDNKEKKSNSDESKKIESIINIKELGKLLSNAKEEIEIEKPKQPGQEDQEPKKEKLKLKDINQGLSNYLKTSPISPTVNKSIGDKQKEPIKNLKTYLDQIKIKDIWQALKKIKVEPGKKVTDADEVKELKAALKNSETIKDINNNLYNVLNLEKNKQVNAEKAKYHGLNISESVIKDPQKDTNVNSKIKKKYSYLQDLNLAEYRKYVKDINQFINNISQAIS
ncbi:molecular chaperone DnaJ [Candidatus Babela massiliensis]|uniref:DnaJ-domain containing protein n=1 Tax=Candidatus Babela massiliensis TaxID=673862 RepID=V6DF12_9BACT|nr:molecular chaperone DnaJ [Candidatus Babela massiliensis]CDK30165.1 DnaJ-domain containing protein [Candidatus Babela massiliensis]